MAISAAMNARPMSRKTVQRELPLALAGELTLIARCNRPRDASSIGQEGPAAH